MKKVLATVVACLLVILSFIGIAQNVSATGFTVESGDTVVVSEAVDGSLFVTGGDVIIEGDVEGTVFAAGETITIKGNINGTLFVAGNNIMIEGNVEGEVFAAGNMIRTSENVELNRDVFAAGNQVWMNGVVGRDLFVGSNSSHIQNEVGRDARISTNTLHLDENGQINGDLFYQAREEVDNVDDFVQGEVSYERQVPPRNQMMDMRPNILLIVLRIVGIIISAMLIWMFLRGITQNRWITISPQLINRPILLTFLGLGVSILMIITIILTLISIVFTSIGVLMLMIFPLLVFLGKIVTASVIGKYLIESRLSLGRYNGLISFMLAYVLLYLAGMIPYVGWVISLICITYTIGLAFRETVLRFQMNTV